MKTLSSGVAGELVQDVQFGLSREQKELPSKYLYDELGSALFETITLLPEYGLTRADERIVRTHAADFGRLARPDVVAELGSGSGRKTRPILEAAQASRYHPIDISPAALDRCAAELGSIPGLTVEPVLDGYLEGLERVNDGREKGARMLLLFLGSTIGNFDREGARHFLFEVRRRLQPGDTLLLGADLVKPLDVLIAAYDDALGVTAAFNKNVLLRLNRELGADFDLSQFRHVARYNTAVQRIEMHLESLTDQCVSIPEIPFRVQFQAGETIWTEASHKFKPGEVAAMGERAGFRCLAEWVDGEWPFAEILFVVKP
jgi:dimethylhistidine N-methyltransferase